MSSDWKDWEHWVNAFPEYDDMNFNLDADDFRAYVPLESVGKKQVGRLVYQVIGKDGPVFNPTNIRYLSPGDLGYPSNLPALNSTLGMNLSNLTPVFAGLNLVASVANLAVSAVILHKVSKLEKQIEDTKREILGKLDVIDQKVTHIDIKVREMHLRESLNYLNRSCIRDNTIDLIEIKKLERDIAGFVQSLEPFEYGNLAKGFDLAYDMRERLTSFHAFLFHTRAMVARAYNVGAREDPSSVVSVDPVTDYRPQEYLERSIRTVKEERKRYIDEERKQRLAEQLPKSVQETKLEKMKRKEKIRSSRQAILDSLTPDEKQKPGFETLFKVLVGPHVEDFVKQIPTLAQEGARLTEEYKVSISKMVHPLTGELVGIEEYIRSDAWRPKEEFAWLWNTDMGLIWRLWKELRGLGDYQKEFPSWKKVAALPAWTNQIMIDCSSGEFIGFTKV